MEKELWCRNLRVPWLKESLGGSEPMARDAYLEIAWLP